MSSNAERQRRYRARKRLEVEERKRWARGLPPAGVAEERERRERAELWAAHRTERAELLGVERAACAEVGVSMAEYERHAPQTPEAEPFARVCALIRAAGFDPDQRRRLEEET